MKPTTFRIMFQDVVLSLQSQGFKKMVVILGHGTFSTKEKGEKIFKIQVDSTVDFIKVFEIAHKDKW